ncbi:MAG TPA: sigma-70 family RNA polymerase sigma factor, partial [Polyangiaceae bacterium]|nr:sigma-70 family RNA polymerase sigma factor [Polyangiaceae bacterium]
MTEQGALPLERERVLAARAQDGDRDALAELLRLHGPRLYRSVLLPRLGSHAAAEDALSVTYMKVVERIAQFSWQEVGFYPWL